MRKTYRSADGPIDNARVIPVILLCGSHINPILGARPHGMIANISSRLATACNQKFTRMLHALVLGNTITLVTLRTRTRWLCGLPRLPLLIPPSRHLRASRISVASMYLGCWLSIAPPAILSTGNRRGVQDWGGISRQVTGQTEVGALDPTFAHMSAAGLGT